MVRYFSRQRQNKKKLLCLRHGASVRCHLQETLFRTSAPEPQPGLGEDSTLHLKHQHYPGQDTRTEGPSPDHDRLCFSLLATTHSTACSLPQCLPQGLVLIKDHPQGICSCPQSNAYLCSRRALLFQMPLHHRLPIHPELSNH